MENNQQDFQKIAHVDADRERSESLHNFEATYRTGFLEFLEVASIIDTPMPLDPQSLAISDQSYEELDSDYKRIMEEVILGAFGVTRTTLAQYREREYMTPVPNGGEIAEQIHIIVYRTNRENVFLQELRFADGEVRFVAGPNQDNY